MPTIFSKIVSGEISSFKVKLATIRLDKDNPYEKEIEVDITEDEFKDKVNELNTFNLSKESRNSHVMEEITKLENMLQIIQKKILSKNNDGY